MSAESPAPAASPTHSEHHAAAAPRELQLRAARAAIVGEIGAERLAALHRGCLPCDIAAIAGAIGLFLACAFVLATRSVSSPLWWLCFVIQGDLVLIMAFINHDAFVHRKLFAPRLRWVLSSILVWPSQLRGATYERQHLTHHRALGSDRDTEVYKQSIDTAVKRILYATAGAMIYRAFFLKGQTSSVSLQATSQEPAAARNQSRERWERATRWVILAAVAGLTLWDWRYLVFGYLLPFAVVTPVLNTTRIVLEHLDLDRSNPLWVGTFYRTGPLTRLMFWWDAGDCHLVHHFYANIPFYRMGRALDEMRPILIRAGVQEQRSLARLLFQWFSGARAHWSLPTGTVKP